MLSSAFDQPLPLGELTEERKKEGDRKLIEGFRPTTTPNGILVDSSTKCVFLERMTPDDFPTLAIESAIAEYRRANQGRVDWNSMVDKFRLISSLPHVDFVVSDDRYLHLLFPIAQNPGFAKAAVIKFNEFCVRFLD